CARGKGFILYYFDYW
nr:immunoglobulin heavy chain junction region [Macaca mulatta]MOX66939.1 immunoglobulin heavy chain junction region [Macaca mulatta]